MFLTLHQHSSVPDPLSINIKRVRKMIQRGKVTELYFTRVDHITVTESIEDIYKLIAYTKAKNCMEKWNGAVPVQQHKS
jgi:hypothetical protein